MKSIIRLFVIVLAMSPAISFAQAKTQSWPQKDNFHAIMAATFHPAEDGDLKPLKMKADSLYMTAKLWMESNIPSNYKPDDTKIQLKKLVDQTEKIASEVKQNTSDAELTRLISEAHDTFHKIVGECRIK